MLSSSSSIFVVADETPMLQENAAKGRRPMPFQPTIVLVLRRTTVALDLAVVVAAIAVDTAGDYIDAEDIPSLQVPFDVPVVGGASEEKEEEEYVDCDDAVPKWE